MINLTLSREEALEELYKAVKWRIEAALKAGDEIHPDLLNALRNVDKTELEKGKE